MLSIANIDPHFTNMVDNNSSKDHVITVQYDPIEIMPGNITPEPPMALSMEFSNYDVLLMPCEEKASEQVLCAPGNHVGNQRFRVLLSISRQRYLQADERGNKEECTRIAREVMDTVYHKCVPNGRFYEQNRDKQWQELQLGPSTIAMIQSALKNEPKDSLPEERSPKRFCIRRMGSIVSTDSEEEATVAIPNRFDVICDAGGLKLKQDCDHTGNNRLKVVLDIRRQRYNKSNRKGRQAIAQEVVSSIIDDASSQFLQVDESSGMYKTISREMATACITKTFDAKSEGNKKAYRISEVKKLMDRRKKKQLLGSLERRNNDKGKKSCKLPSVSSCALSTTTTFKAFQMVDTSAGLAAPQAAL